MAYELKYKKYENANKKFSNDYIQQTQVIANDSLSLYRQDYYRENNYRLIRPLKREEYGKKLFLVCDGKLRQFVFLKSLFFPFVTQCGLRNLTELYERQRIDVLRVAGIGDVYTVSTSNFRCDFTVFKSIEDYKNGVEYTPSICEGIRDEVVESLRRMFEVNASSGDIYYYKWNGAQVLKYSLRNVPHYAEYGKNGVEFNEEFISQWIGRTDIYKTAKECREDNEIQIELLGDDDYADQERTFKVNVLGMECTATDKELRKAIKVLTKTLGK